MLTLIMADPAPFLLARAEELRQLATRSPEIAFELRRMAEMCEQQADLLRQGSPRRA